MRRQGDDRSGVRRRQRRTLTLQHDVPVADGEDVATLIRAVVHARLLGIRLLTLDARVVVANDVDTSRAGLAAPDRLTLVAPDPDAVPVARSGDVTTARELLAQGADTLARTESAIRSNRRS